MYSFAGETVLAPFADGAVDFADEIYPLLRERCFECHQGSEPESGVRLDHYAKLLGETDGVPLVVAGDSARSRLVQVVSGAVKDKVMPPPDAGPRLNADQVGLLRDWIDQGANWDEELLPDPNQVLAAEHWAFRPVLRPAVPDGTANPIDAFIWARHSERKLTAAVPAEKTKLIRRLYLVLHGLPPTREQIKEFLGDTSSRAWQQLVERVLHSRHYGERIARHWLDYARWAESEGFAQNNDRLFAWRYRDYVIDSFNSDKPYTEFLRQQIAGDELQPYSDENLIATGFLAAARISADDLHFYRAENDMYTDMVNTLSSAVLGLTIGCARCHDHKFDPISQRDFYRLQAFFARGFPGNVVLADAPRPEKIDEVARELLAFDLKVRERVLSEGFDEQPPPLRKLLYTSEAQRSLEQERIYRPARIGLNIRVAGCNGFRIKEDEKKRLESLRSELNGLVEGASQTWGFYSPVTSPHQLSTLPMAGNFPLLHDRRRLMERPSYLLARGRIFDPVGVVNPGWPAAFGATTSPHLKASPRTALADWLTSNENPLTARVWVNRIWQMHFGIALVDTPGNFGLHGNRPSHPKLLDWLAAELMDHDWSTRHIHRLIVNSETWQQSSLHGKSDSPFPSDPDNRYLWRWPRRRLEAEAIRDSMLSVSGELDRTVGGSGVPLAEEATSARRGIYLFQKRHPPPAMQMLFDGPMAMAEACVQRDVSTSPLQPLYLLNNEFSRDRSRALANRIRSIAGEDVDRQIELAFELALSRIPDDYEREACRAFLLESPGSKQQDGPQSDPDPHHGERRNRRSHTGGGPANATETPVPKDHLSLWLRADVGVLGLSGDAAEHMETVTTWLDQAWGDNQVVDALAQKTAHRQPRYVNQLAQRINDLPVVRFAGGAFGRADQFLTAPDQDELDVTSSYTLFAIVRFNGRGQGNEVVFLKAHSGGNDIATLGLIRMAADSRITVGQNIAGQWADRLQSSRPAPDHVPLLIVVRWNGSMLELDVFDRDGRLSSDSVELKGTIDPGTGGRLSIGGYTDAFSDDGERLNGDLGEILYYRSDLSNSQRDEAIEYLRRRWLMAPSLGTPLEVFSQALLNLNELFYIE